jgi:GTPase SAR1 family protein
MHNTVSEEIVYKIQNLREGPLETLNRSLESRDEPFPVVSDDELDSFLLQVKHKMLLVAVVGEGSSGKSTLLNTFLRDHYLPTGVKRNTAVRIYIGHRSSCHQEKCQDPTGICPGCPTLSNDFKRRNIICK